MRRAMRFEAQHKAQFGFVYENKPMVVEAVGVEGNDSRARGRSETDSALEEIDATPSGRGKSSSRAAGRKPVFFAVRKCGPATRCTVRR